MDNNSSERNKRLRLGFLIKEARMYANLQQEELAKKIGKSTRTICNYENGHTVPSMPILLKLTDVLKESLALIGKENMFIDSAITTNENLLLDDSDSFFILKNGFYLHKDNSDKFLVNGTYTSIWFVFEDFSTNFFKDCYIYEIENIQQKTKEIRRVQKLSDEKYKLFYDNPKYEPIVLQSENIKFLGIAIAKIEML
jgi:DNA-binding XRE family transcriptional regulator